MNYTLNIREKHGQSYLIVSPAKLYSLVTVTVVFPTVSGPAMAGPGAPAVAAVATAIPLAAPGVSKSNSFLLLEADDGAAVTLAALAGLLLATVEPDSLTVGRSPNSAAKIASRSGLETEIKKKEAKN